MITLNIPIIVEGKYDKIKLGLIVDTLIIATNGFEIFKNSKCANMIRDFAKKDGVIVLTDSDSAGKIIREHIKSIVKDGKVYNAYIPKIKGKEKRKSEYSKQGLLGVEGMEERVLIDAIKKSGAMCSKPLSKLKKADLYELGLTGRQNSKQLRKRIMKELNLPDNLSSNELISYFEITLSREELKRLIDKIKEEA